MATVAVTIAGRSYRMACGEGEEARLQDLGRHVDVTLAGLRKGFGEVGDTRLVIMTAITVADELAGFAATRSEGEAMRDALAVEVAGSLEAASARLERLAQTLNQAGKN